jgi:hypothetical protein
MLKLVLIGYFRICRAVHACWWLADGKSALGGEFALVL